MKLKKLNKSYLLLTETDKELGSFQLDSDGSYYFYHNQGLTGCWTGNNLRDIADKLDEVNRPFDEKVSAFFDEVRFNFQECARLEYIKLLNDSGMFFEFYPQLSGDWEKDELEWFEIYKELEELISNLRI